MSTEQTKSDLAFIQEFKRTTLRYITQREAVRLFHAQQPEDLFSYTGNQGQSVGDYYQKLMATYMPTRAEYVRSVARADEIAFKSLVPFTLSLHQTREGYITQGNSIFRLLLEDIPYENAFNPLRIEDTLNAMIGVCEKELSDAEFTAANPDPWWKKTGAGLKRVYEYLFRTDAQKLALGWILVVAIGVSALRLAGINVLEGVKFAIELYRGK
jgi:hypothetical protein